MQSRSQEDTSGWAEEQRCCKTQAHHIPARPPWHGMLTPDPESVTTVTGTHFTPSNSAHGWMNSHQQPSHRSQIKQTLTKTTKTSYHEPEPRCQGDSTRSRLGLYLQLAQHKQRQGPRGAHQEPGGAPALCPFCPVMQKQLLQRTKSCLEQGAPADLQNPCSGGDSQNREEVYG